MVNLYIVAFELSAILGNIAVLMWFIMGRLSRVSTILCIGLIAIPYLFDKWSFLGKVIITIIPAILAALNTSRYGLLFLFLGSISNSFVTIANGMKMPVLVNSSYLPHYVPMSNITRFNFLGDWIALSPQEIISIGDILIVLSGIVMFIEAMYDIKARRQK